MSWADAAAVIGVVVVVAQYLHERRDGRLESDLDALRRRVDLLELRRAGKRRGRRSQP